MRGLGHLLVQLLLWAPVALADNLDTPDCVEVSKETPYQAYGYTHIVVIHNTCDKDVDCEASTDVDRQPRRTSVAKDETRRLVFRRGSPARSFEANVSCEERD